MTVAFTNPWLLSALIVLPLLWLLLRAVPPAPVSKFFPGVILLLGLNDETQTSDRTPWWLLMLRMLVLSLVIIGLAGPVMNPLTATEKRAQLLILLDGGWASVRDWEAHQTLLHQVLRQAARNGQRVALARLTNPETPVFGTAQAAQNRIVSFAPQPWAPRANEMLTALEPLEGQRFDILWLSDGLAQPGRNTLLATLQKHGAVEVIETGKTLIGLEPAQLQDGMVSLFATRLTSANDQTITVIAHGTDPSGQPQVVARMPATFAAGKKRLRVQISLPKELRERVSRFEIEDQPGAAAISLTGNSLSRPKVALVSDQSDRERLDLLSPMHFLTKAFAPTADLVTGNLTTLLPANPDLIVLADIAKLSKDEQEQLTHWIKQGGLLLRFSGARIAASNLSRDSDHPLMPVRLRAGGRSVGGAMSWGAPKTLADFAPNSPFFGLDIPPDVSVSTQVLAQPNPTLPQRVISALSDGTPLVTRKMLGEGQIVLFHVTANAEWSSLPLSGLFVQMLERLSRSISGKTSSAEILQGTVWKAEQTLTAHGQLETALQQAGVTGKDLFSAPLSATLRPGLYSHAGETAARNVLPNDTILQAAKWPLGTNLRGLNAVRETPLAGWCLILALLAMLVDVAATLALTRPLVSVAALIGLFAVLSDGWKAEARQELTTKKTVQEVAVSGTAIRASSELSLAYILTGNAKVDAISELGLTGLSRALTARTSVEPAAPTGLNLERDDLVFYPLLYWPMTSDQKLPSQQAYRKLNDFMRSGGMILFDTRDGDIADFSSATANGKQLEKISYELDIPTLEVIPADHILTRTFYLLQDFPGRYSSADIWVESAPQAKEKAARRPFRNLNDGVSPVVIGANDWAAAWAQDAQGRPMFPVGRSNRGDRQRELAYRFGINLVMHVLTGNYKSDQVHVPALLERLGQ